jgi:hypothetical protein
MDWQVATHAASPLQGCSQTKKALHSGLAMQAFIVAGHLLKRHSSQAVRGVLPEHAEHCTAAQPLSSSTGEIPSGYIVRQAWLQAGALDPHVLLHASSAVQSAFSVQVHHGAAQLWERQVVHGSPALGQLRPLSSGGGPPPSKGRGEPASTEEPSPFPAALEAP